LNGDFPEFSRIRIFTHYQAHAARVVTLYEIGND
jgi:hypothetical protein